MKGAFELGLVMLFGIPIFVTGLNFVQVMMNYNQARYYQDYAVTTIERQNRFDDDIQELIEEKQGMCKECELHVIREDERYKVEVTFPLNVTLLSYTGTGEVKTYTKQIR